MSPKILKNIPRVLLKTFAQLQTVALFVYNIQNAVRETLWENSARILGRNERRSDFFYNTLSSVGYALKICKYHFRTRCMYTQKTNESRTKK